MKSILFLQYNGLGDAVINAPFIEALTKDSTISYIYVPYNAMLDFLIHYFDRYKKIKYIEPNLRSIFYINKLENFLVERRITHVVSFRRDLYENSEQLAKCLKLFHKININYISYANFISIDELENENIFSVNRLLLTRYNYKIALPQSLFGYFSKIVSQNNKCTFLGPKVEIAIFVGASQVQKRLDASLWGKIISYLSKSGIMPVLIRSKKEEERIEECQLINIIRNYGFHIDIEEFNSFHQLSDLLSKCHGLICCDTFIAHFSVALGIRTFTIFVSTDSKVYGSYGTGCYCYQNSAYYSCSKKNKIGNCDGWGHCTSMDCKKEFRYIDLLEQIRNWLTESLAMSIQ